MRRALPISCASAVLAIGIATQALAFSVPPLTGPVVDQAGLLSVATEQTLDAALRRLVDQGGTQIAILTVDDLGGEPIEQASIQVADSWKLGSAKKDDGVLLLVAKAERAVRIEVGQGREGVLTDAYSRRIIDDVIVPRFRSGDFDGGVIAGIAAIARYTDPELQLGLKAGGRPARQWNERNTNVPGWFVLMFILSIMFIRFFGGHRGMHSRGWGSSSGWGGGRSSGGGWSGGGGGFSGGGASGRW